VRTSASEKKTLVCTSPYPWAQTSFIYLPIQTVKD